MKFLKNEKNILNLIKYGPILFVIVFSIIITQVFISQKENNLDYEIEQIKEVYFANNKDRVQEEVNRVFESLKEEKKSSEEALKKEIKSRVYEAHQIATNIYIEESKVEGNGHNHSREHVFGTIKNALGSIIFNEGRGYFFIADDNGKSLLQPLNKEFEGKNFLDHKDANGYVFANKMIETIKNKTEAYDSYYWYKADNKIDTYKKISFYKYFEPFNIIIGTGEYVADFENKLKQKALEKIKRISFGENGYIFVIDTKGNNLAHYKPKLVGANTMKVQDDHGRFIIKDMLDFAVENQKGFFSYLTRVKPGFETKSREKISYVRLFEDWDWVIGTGFYLDKLDQTVIEKKKLLEKSNKEAIKKIINLSTLLTMIFIFISFTISKFIAMKFKSYKKDIEDEISKTIEKEKLLIQQSKMATMGEMLGNIGHQWKQPLSLINASSNLIRLNSDFEKLTTKDIHSSTKNIENAVEYLSQTVDDFKNFFNPNKEKRYFYIDNTFTKTLSLISSQFKNNSIEVVRDVDDFEFYGFENELLQTLINILKNAKDELIKKDKKERRLIFIDSHKKDNEVVIQIKDNANGIPKEIISKIFDSYFTTKDKHDGTGIGLYICKQIIEENMQGSIIVSNVEYTFENVNYKGAEFTITLPL